MTKKKKADENGGQREISIGLYFLKYFLYIFTGIVLAVLFFTFAFSVLLQSDIVYPASYAEQQAKAAVEEIQKAERVTADLIPELCRYVVFDEEGHVLSGDMSAKEVRRAWNVLNGREYNGGTFFGSDFYLGIPRGSECCVLRYQLIVQYQSAALRRFLPQPEILMILFFLAVVLVIILSAAVRFHSVVRKKLSPLADAADRIRQQELEFEIARGNLREINTILEAMDKMRSALKESLEKQWKQEQAKQEQMAALAHDLKTPLTLVRGNAELLADTCLTEEQKEYTGCITDSAVQMQDYVQMMLAVIRSSSSVSVSRKKVSVTEFLAELKRQAAGLCTVHHVELQWDCADLTGRIDAEPRLLMRAFMNLFANAAEHTPTGKSILFEGRQDETHVTFAVTDAGEGFTPSALCHAKEQFYMDDESRGADSHYGMGLYIADTIVRQHEGELALENVRAVSLADTTGETAGGNMPEEGTPRRNISCKDAPGGGRVVLRLPVV